MSTPKPTQHSTLRTVRKARGMSLRRVAEEARIDVGHLSRVERGEAGLSLAGLRRLASVLGLRELDGMLELYTPSADGSVKSDRTRSRRRPGGGTAAAVPDTLDGARTKSWPGATSARPSTNDQADGDAAD